MQNQTEKNMENDMETGIVYGFKGIYLYMSYSLNSLKGVIQGLGFRV